MTRILVTGGWALAAIGAFLVCLYAVLVYFIVTPGPESDLGIDAFFEHRLGLQLHVAGSAVALALGPVQLYLRRLTPPSRREKARPLHRRLGRLYVAGALLGASAGTYLAFYAHGGIVAQLGFGSLGIATLGTTIAAFLAIRKGQEEDHRAWMARSYSLIFAAVTLRLYLPFLEAAFGFDDGYRIVAWLSWLPNLAVAEVMIRRGPGSVPAAASLS